MSAMGTAADLVSAASTPTVSIARSAADGAANGGVIGSATSTAHTPLWQVFAIVVAVVIGIAAAGVLAYRTKAAKKNGPASPSQAEPRMSAGVSS